MYNARRWVVDYSTLNFVICCTTNWRSLKYYYLTAYKPYLLSIVRYNITNSSAIDLIIYDYLRYYLHKTSDLYLFY